MSFLSPIKKFLVRILVDILISFTFLHLRTASFFWFKARSISRKPERVSRKCKIC
jgi:hypothetical protein